MRFNAIALGLLGLTVSVVTANAWDVSGVVSCPNEKSAAGIKVTVVGVGETFTTANGAFFLLLPDVSATYTICVDEGTLPDQATLVGKDCVKFSVDDDQRFADVNFTLGGPFCETPPPPGPCWLTGGGTIGKGKGAPNYSYGGVVNPGCSPTAAGGGNWNVIDHFLGLHFKGLDIAVIACSGVPTKSPRVNVNIIDFMGTGTLVGLDGNGMALTPVCFVARAIDASEPGAGKDALYLRVYDCTTLATLMLISTDPAHPETVAPVTISTGNLQIHTSSCQ